MKDLYLKTPAEADMKAALIAAGIVTEQTIATEVGATEDGDAILQDVMALVPTEGFYVDQIPLSVEPTVPYRVWA